jgi:UDP-N-acetylmuramoyl-L-alanyl-D-glutamate--2,6-diaminopimelate ligase
MTRLKDPQAAARWLASWVRGQLRTDSRQVQPGDAFIAWPGYATDGRKHVRAALEAGAATCLVEGEGISGFGFEDARIAALMGLKAATGLVADAFYHHPSQSLRVVAVTGTNGKTSSAWWVAQALSALGQRCGVVGTLGVGEPPRIDQLAGPHDGHLTFTGLTTPDPVLLQASLQQMVDDGYAACAIEASSIGIVEQRLHGTTIEVALFTNFTRDHLDYHQGMDAYWTAKRQLFDWPGLKAAVINVDDPHGAALVAELAGKGLDLWTVSALDQARLSATGIGYFDGGLTFTVVEGSHQVPVRTHLIGDYNVNNLLGVIGGLRALGVPLAAAAKVAGAVSPVPGRMQRLPAVLGTAEVVVDYAHTPDALEKALAALRPLVKSRGGRLWCVFGCGGNRDASKRPVMGRVAATEADRVVVTSDNPLIIGQIMEGVPGGAASLSVQVEADRRLAILETLAEAAAEDVVLIAGKGHEDYQEIHGVKHPFSDAVVAMAAMGARSHA